MRSQVVLTAVMATLACGALVSAQCREGRAVRHERPDGQFDFTTTVFDSGQAICQPGPPTRLWIPARSVLADESQSAPCFGWLQSARDHLGVPTATPSRWIAVYPSWGCAPGAVPPFDGDVLETSFADALREGTPDHRGLYLVAIPAPGCGLDDLDRVADGDGAHGNVVPAEEIPPPEPAPLAVWNTVDLNFVNVTCTLRPLRSYGPAGHAEVIRGYRLLYAPGSPTSEAATSDPSAWQPVRDPASPAQPLATIPLGATSVVGAVPRSLAGETYVDLAVQVIDEATASLPLESRGTSSHRRAQTGTPGPAYPDLALAQTLTPTTPAPGTPVTLRLDLTNRSSVAAAAQVRLWDNLGDLPVGCLDLASAQPITCPLCDAANLDPVTGKLRASRAALGAGETLTLTLVVNAGAGSSSGNCANVAWGDAERHRFVRAASSLDNVAGPILLKDAVAMALGGQPSFDRVFPLHVFLDPAPTFPFTEAALTLTDSAHPIIFWENPGAPPLYVVKELASESVVLSH